MSKKAKAGIVLAIWITIGVCVIWNQNAKDNDKVIEAFNITGSANAESYIDAYGYF